MKPTHLAGALCSFLLICSNPTLAADQTPDQLEQIKLKSAKWGVKEQKATALTKAAKYQEAEKIYKQIIAERQALDLDLYPDYDSLGLLYMSWGKKEKAEKTFQDMVTNRERLSGASSQDVINPLNEYAKCLDKLGKKDEAKKLRARAAEIQKDIDTIPTFGKISGAAGSPERLAEAEKMRTLGEKWMKAEQQAKALVYFERAVALNANDAQALCDRGDAEQWSEKNAKALIDLNKAIKLQPDLKKAYISRALLHENQNHYAQALTDFTKAVTLDPKDTETMGSLAKLLDEQGKHKEAVEYYGKIIATQPALYWPYVQRAVANAAMGQYKAAISDYSTLVERSPEDGDYYEYRGAVYVKAGDLQKALDDYNHLVALSPKYPVGYRERAKIYEKMDGKKSPRVVSDYATVKKLGY